MFAESVMSMTGLKWLLLDKRRLYSGMAFGVAATLCAVLLSLTGLFSSLDYFFQDLTARSAQVAASGQTVVVRVDGKTLQKLGGYPFDRSKIATVLKRLDGAKVKKIYLDITFGYKGSLAGDENLLQVMKGIGKHRLALPVSTFAETDKDGNAVSIELKPLQKFSQYVTKVSGDLSFIADGRFVREVGRDTLGKRVSYPTIADWFVGRDNEKPNIFKINYAIQKNKMDQVSFLDVLNGKVEASRLSGKNIIIGLTAGKTAYPLAVPLYGSLYRPDIIALSAETRLLGQTISQASDSWVIMTSLIFALLLGLVLQRYNATTGLFILLTVVLSIIAIASMFREAWRMDIGLAIAVLTVILVYIGVQLAYRPIFSRFRQAVHTFIDRIDLTHIKLLHASNDAIITFTPEGELLTMNQSAEELFDKNAEDCIGKPISEILPDHAERLLLDAAHQQPGRLQAQLGEKEKGARHLDMSYNAMPAQEGWVGLVSIRDITELKSREETLIHEANHDVLTGVANRAGFEKRIKATMRLAQDIEEPFAVLMIDLDKFKQVNDTLGHHVGDVVLQTVAGRLNKILRKSDFVARLGGDEFAVIMSSPVEKADAEGLADKIVKSISEPVRCEGEVAHIGASIGIAIYGEHSDNLDILLRCADEAMYDVKKAGRNGFAVAKPHLTLKTVS